MNRQAGFSMIEFGAVLVILVLLVAMAIPRFASVQTDTLRAAQDNSSNAVKSAHSVAIARLQQLPTVTELAAYVQGQDNPTAVDSGIQVTINETDYVVPTYSDGNCSIPTAADSHSVACVGSIPWP